MKNVHFLLSFCIVFWVSIFVFQKINLVTADLGRHLTSGRLFLNAESLSVSRSALLHTNFFSISYPKFPFVNHHWGSGIVLFIFYSLFGFEGLSLVYGGCLIAAVLLLFYITRRSIPLYITFPLVVLLVPLIAERTEVRPEGFSYLFIALFIAIIYLFTRKLLDRKYLLCIPFLSLLWINMHIYFIIGFFIIGAFLLEQIVHKDWEHTKIIGGILVASVLVSFLNPYGVTAILYPFVMFQNYGYLIVENQSIPFLIRYGINNPTFFWWGVCTALFILLTCLTFFKKMRSFPLALFLIAAAFGVLSFFAIRHMSAYGLVLLPVFSVYLSLLLAKPHTSSQRNILLSWGVSISSLLVIFTIVLFNSRMPWSTHFGIGLIPGVLQSAQFMQENNITGPLFSNYDIGGYIIFTHFPDKVFVDNRPEAYPASFFKNTYIPMQTDEIVWRKEVAQWNFRTIWFYRNDMTPWAQQFLIARVKDPEWAPVFVDEQTIIFLKRNASNAPVISRFELPKSMFNTR